MNPLVLEVLVGGIAAAGLLLEKFALARALQKEGKKIMAQFEDEMATAEQAAGALATSLTKISTEFDADLAALKAALANGSQPSADQLARLSAHSSGLSALAQSAQALADAHVNDVAPAAPPAPVVTPDPAPAAG